MFDKVIENIRFHLENYNCRHILMGISHDPSYATFLNKVSQDEFCRRRITIIEGTPTVPELIATNIPSLDLGRQLFCSATSFSEKGPYDLCPRSSTQGLQPVSPDQYCTSQQARLFFIIIRGRSQQWQSSASDFISNTSKPHHLLGFWASKPRYSF